MRDARGVCEAPVRQGEEVLPVGLEGLWHYPIHRLAAGVRYVLESIFVLHRCVVGNRKSVEVRTEFLLDTDQVFSQYAVR